MNARAKQIVKSMPKVRRKQTIKIARKIAKDFGPAIKKLAET